MNPNLQACLTFAGEHPVVTILLAIIVAEIIIRFFKYVAYAIRG